MTRAIVSIAAGVVLLAACGGTPATTAFPASAYPQRLSAWGVLGAPGELAIPADAMVYDLNTPLFSDYAMKLRTLHIPAGQAAAWDRDDVWTLPTGSVISKTFFYPRGPRAKSGAARTVALTSTWAGDAAALNHLDFELLETRLLVRQDHGWDALPYVWRGDDAYLAITGTLLELEADDAPLNYLVPSRNQCASCHATDHTSGEIQPIGLRTRHLNRDAPPGSSLLGNQIVALAERGMLEGVDATVAWHQAVPLATDLEHGSATLEERARAYLDINCSHCHNPEGPADTSALLLDYETHAAADLGVCKPPIAAGQGSGGRLYGIVPGDADASILVFRMGTSNPATMMPELGRSLVHREGLALVSAWIDGMTGACR